MVYYETPYSELQQLTQELMNRSADLSLAALRVVQTFDDEVPEEIQELTDRMQKLGDPHYKLHRHFELEVNGFESLDTHFAKKLAPYVGKLQLVFQELAYIQRSMRGESDGSAEDHFLDQLEDGRLLDQLEMDNMRWCEEISEILKNWYNRKKGN